VVFDVGAGLLLIQKDVEEGRIGLNLSEWNRRSASAQRGHGSTAWAMPRPAIR